ncbi:MAG: flagellar basal body-associated FliL family protein [Pseudomonadota bacterium]
MADDAKEAEDAPAAKPKSKLKLLIFAGLALVLLVGGGVGAAFALGVFGGGESHSEAAETDHGGDDHGAASDDDHGGGGSAGHGDGHGDDDGVAAGQPTFVDLPQLLVNLTVEQSRPRFLKLSLAVEVAEAHTADRIAQLSPRIVDSFQMYLRTLRPEDLQGAGSMFRLKQELHVRIQQAIQPDRVEDVLFKEMLVQ